MGQVVPGPCILTHMLLPGITLRELAFIRDVLVPRAWVQGAEVDELIRLRARIDGIFAAVQEPPAPPEAGPPPPPVEPAPAGRKKKPRHSEKQRGSPPPHDGS